MNILKADAFVPYATTLAWFSAVKGIQFRSRCDGKAGVHVN